MRFKGRTIWLSAALLAALALGLYLRGAGHSGADRKGDRGPQAVLVSTTRVSTHEFVDLIEAIGTARANESIDITAKSTETIAAINFTDGQSVPSGFAIAELSSREQSADLASAHAALKEVEQALKRTEELVSRGYVSKANRDTAKAARDTAAARVTAMQSRLSDRLLRAPFAGRLGLRHVSVGTLVKPGDLITTLDDTSRIKVDFTVPETRIATLKSGLPVKAVAAAFPGRHFAGTIDSLDTRIDPVSRAIAVRAIIPNTDGTLLPGMLLTIGIESARRKSLAVPEQALVPVEAKQYVYVVGPDLVADRREVTIGAREPGLVEIISGLKPTESVVVEGTLRLQPGATVKLARAGKPSR